MVLRRRAKAASREAREGATDAKASSSIFSVEGTTRDLASSPEVAFHYLNTLSHRTARREEVQYVIEKHGILGQRCPG